MSAMTASLSREDTFAFSAVPAGWVCFRKMPFNSRCPPDDSNRLREEEVVVVSEAWRSPRR